MVLHCSMCLMGNFIFFTEIEHGLKIGGAEEKDGEKDDDARKFVKYLL